MFFNWSVQNSNYNQMPNEKQIEDLIKRKTFIT
jgi:hypothetical protein